MVERDPNIPQDNEGQPAFFDDPEFIKQWSRLEKLTAAHAILAHAQELDDKLHDQKLTKSFLSKSAGDAQGGNYPFPHLRVKLKPKNHSATPIKVVALRYPTDISFSHQLDKLYVAYEDPEGEHMFYLSANQYSRLTPALAFVDPGEGTVLEPRADGLTHVDDMDLVLLESILGANGDFEPDLQPHVPDIAA